VHRIQQPLIYIVTNGEYPSLARPLKSLTQAAGIRWYTQSIACGHKGTDLSFPLIPIQICSCEQFVIRIKCEPGAVIPQAALGPLLAHRVGELTQKPIRGHLVWEGKERRSDRSDVLPPHMESLNKDLFYQAVCRQRLPSRFERHTLVK
jgi:hypothetical protein